MLYSFNIFIILCMKDFLYFIHILYIVLKIIKAELEFIPFLVNNCQFGSFDLRGLSLLIHFI